MELDVGTIIWVGLVFGMSATTGTVIAVYTIFCIGEWWEKYMVKEEDK